MSEKLQTIINVLEKIAPRTLAESWDNVGLQIGCPSKNINKIITVLDVTEDNATWAAENDVDLIVAHHPLILKPISHVRSDMPQGALISKLIKHDIAVYIMHTNIDIASGGLNDLLAEKLHLEDVELLKNTHEEILYKIAVYVPNEHINDVFVAMTGRGAGHIGNYSHCTFRSEGVGTFLPLEKAKPFVGIMGNLEMVAENKLETVVTEKNLNKVVNAMLKAHPYEEVAYDVYRLAAGGKKSGPGRKGHLAEKMTLREFAEHVKRCLSLSTVGVVGDSEKNVYKVALCGGAGASMIYDAYFAGADVLVTGDIKYHEAQAADALGLALIDAGHFATEVHIADFLADYLTQKVKSEKWRILQDNISVGVSKNYICYL